LCKPTSGRPRWSVHPARKPRLSAKGAVDADLVQSALESGELLVIEFCDEQLRDAAHMDRSGLGDVREAVAGGTGFLWEINGTDGTLRITADAAQPQIFPLTVAGARGSSKPAELPAPPASTQKWPALTSLGAAPAYNVGRAYAAFAADIDNRTHTVPDFADAVRRHEVIAAIERSAASGERVAA
jgi:predicted dehydrogenase